jgi:hypothetical protein
LTPRHVFKVSSGSGPSIVFGLFAGRLSLYNLVVLDMDVNVGPVMTFGQRLPGSYAQ